MKVQQLRGVVSKNLSNPSDLLLGADQMRIDVYRLFECFKRPFVVFE